MKRFKLLSSCNGRTQFSDLPSCLVIHILSRLPIATLVTCICVCKDWIRLFRDPYFIRLQLAASSVHILNRRPLQEIFRFGQVMEGHEEVKVLNLDLPAKGNSLNLPHHHAERYAFKCINSCNGLLCLVDRRSTGAKPFSTSMCFCVCNPILGEWVSISTPVRESHDVTNLVLVFSPKNDQYKLLYGFNAKEDYGFQIYTLGGTRQWRGIDETLGCRPWRSSFYRQDFTTSSFFPPGLLHWVYSNQNEFICCFDIDNEKFRKLSLPSPHRESSRNTCLQLGTVHGCLCALFTFVYQETLSFEVEVWGMKEYGVEKSWTMMLTLQSLSYTSGSYHAVSLPFLFTEEEIVMHDRNDGLLTYNLKSKRFAPGPTYQESTLNPPFVVGYNPSFISLQDVAKGEHLILSRTMQVIQ